MVVRDDDEKNKRGMQVVDAYMIISKDHLEALSSSFTCT